LVCLGGGRRDRRKEEGGRRKEEGGRRKEEGGRRKEGGGRREEEGGRREEEGGKCKEKGEGGGRREELTPADIPDSNEDTRHSLLLNKYLCIPYKVLNRVNVTLFTYIFTNLSLSPTTAEIRYELSSGTSPRSPPSYLSCLWFPSPSFCMISRR
jgi:ATP-dependent RNA helicase DHX57